MILAYYDVNGFLAEGPTARKWAAFGAWAEGANLPETVALYEEGHTKRVTELAAELKGKDVPTEHESIADDLAAAALLATAVLIVSDGDSDAEEDVDAEG